MITTCRDIWYCLGKYKFQYSNTGQKICSLTYFFLDNKLENYLHMNMFLLLKNNILMSRTA